MSRSGINTRPFEYKVGEIIQTKTGDITVTGLIRRKNNSSNARFNKKYIQYKCNIDGYEGEILEYRLKEGGGCLVCGKSRVVTGFNDIATTHPEKVKFFYNEDDAYLYKVSSDKYGDFKCQHCKCKIPHKNISAVLKMDTILCPLCKEKTMSYGEKIMWAVLKRMNIDFYHDVSTEWSHGKRYDFIIPSLNTIIEIDGMQHSIRSFQVKGASTIEENKINDNYKEEIALENGIEYYIHIDTKEYDFNLIKQRIQESKLNELLNLDSICWKLIKEDLITPVAEMCLELWNSGIKSTFDICKELHLGVGTVRNALKTYAELGKCDYDPVQAKIGYKKPEEINYYRQRKVICLNNLFIFDRIIYATRWCGSKHITTVCKGKRSYAGTMPNSKEKLAWQYLEDYFNNHPEINDKESFINEHMQPPILKDERGI